MPVENKFNALPNVGRLAKGREWTYWLRAECPDGLIKIGHSINLKWRLTGLQTQCPVQLSLVALNECPAGTEILLHEVLAEDRAHGEWFYPTDRVEAIRKAMRELTEVEGPQLMDLVAPYGFDAKKVVEILIWGASLGKHAIEDERTMSRKEARWRVEMYEIKSRRTALAHPPRID